jgi:hypothetical protein
MDVVNTKHQCWAGTQFGVPASKNWTGTGSDFEPKLEPVEDCIQNQIPDSIYVSNQNPNQN